MDPLTANRLRSEIREHSNRARREHPGSVTNRAVQRVRRDRTLGVSSAEHTRPNLMYTVVYIVGPLHLLSSAGSDCTIERAADRQPRPACERVVANRPGYADTHAAISRYESTVRPG